MTPSKTPNISCQRKALVYMARGQSFLSLSGKKQDILLSDQLQSIGAYVHANKIHIRKLFVEKHKTYQLNEWESLKRLMDSENINIVIIGFWGVFPKEEIANFEAFSLNRSKIQLICVTQPVDFNEPLWGKHIEEYYLESVKYKGSILFEIGLQKMEMKYQTK